MNQGYLKKLLLFSGGFLPIILLMTFFYYLVTFNLLDDHRSEKWYTGVWIAQGKNLDESVYSAGNRRYLHVIDHDSYSRSKLSVIERLFIDDSVRRTEILKEEFPDENTEEITYKDNDPKNGKGTRTITVKRISENEIAIEYYRYNYHYVRASIMDRILFGVGKIISIPLNIVMKFVYIPALVAVR